ncbi:DUF1049 domain-containing protein [Candidatus Gottesmanbacteria bacterium]|nr:DUF1049 domain-containing protein [Candidatus Gottesmanbacteria bacterium]
MATLIITVLFGLVIAYFATQNTGRISLNFLNYQLPGIPAYIVIIGALLVGLFLSWIISLVNNISTGFTIRGKESKIKDYKKENAELTKRIHQLELENTRIKAETNSSGDDKSL